MLTLPHQKLYMRNLKRKNSHKEKSTMYHMSQYHLPKNPLGKNGWYDIVLCWYCLIKNFIWENRRENSYKEKSAIWCFQQVINQRDERLSPWNLQTFHTNIFYTYEMWSIVDLVNISSRLSQVLSLQMFICPYDLWNRTILMQNIALSITCLHLNNTSCITFIDNDLWFNRIRTT